MQKHCRTVANNLSVEVIMAANINNLFQDKTFPSTLQPDEVISLREPQKFLDQYNNDAPDALASVFLSRVDNNELDAEYFPPDPLPESSAMFTEAPPLAGMPTTLDADHGDDMMETDIQKLESITRGSIEVLMSVETVLPPLIRPSMLYVDRQKLTIVHRSFFGSTDTVSVQMDDINNVEAFIGPMFGEIRIYSKYFVNNVQTLGGLWRKDAVTVRRLVQGYMIAHNKGIDCSKIEKEQLISLLVELGRGSR